MSQHVPAKNNPLSQTRRGLKRSFDRWYSAAIIPAGNERFLLSYLPENVCFSNHPAALEMYELLQADSQAQRIHSHGHLIAAACFGPHPQYEVDRRRVAGHENERGGGVFAGDAGPATKSRV